LTILIASLVHSSNSAPSHVFDQDFTLAALAFLCSRLLSTSRHPRAALVIQSAWRRTLARRTLHHRVIAKQLATQCAAVVHTRNRILWAKKVIVNWWRGRKSKKAKRAARSVNESVKSQTYRTARSRTAAKPKLQRRALTCPTPSASSAIIL
jgi:abnormal spindle-like microcephaly-associated protein